VKILSWTTWTLLAKIVNNAHKLILVTGEKKIEIDWFAAFCHGGSLEGCCADDVNGRWMRAQEHRLPR
jgi:hypothetical protein